MNANFLRTQNYKAHLNLELNQQVDSKSFPNLETNDTSKWNKYEESENTEDDPDESRRLKRLNEEINESCRTQQELRNNPEENGHVFKKSKWSDFINNEKNDVEIS